MPHAARPSRTGPAAARPAVLVPAACLLLGACSLLVPSCDAAPALTTYALASQEALAAADAVRVLDPYLGERLAALEARSPRFRATMDRLRRGPVELVVATTAQSAAVLRGTPGGQLRTPGHTLGAAVTFFSPRSGQVSAVLVHVDVPAATRAARAAGHGDRGRDRVVEEVLVHEVWGHAVPVALAAHVSAACADPGPGEPATAACVIRRENELRQELGWVARDRYSLTVPLARDG